MTIKEVLHETGDDASTLFRKALALCLYTGAGMIAGAGLINTILGAPTALLATVIIAPAIVGLGGLIHWQAESDRKENQRLRDLEQAWKEVQIDGYTS